MLVAQLIDVFVICSFLGWIYECCYCTFRERHWQNRGFLYGPICPIYGSGVVLALIVFDCLVPEAALGEHSMLTIFLVCAVGSAVLEFGTSWVLERYFHALWWDYSDMPFNIQGRICLPATCAFGLAGIVVVRFLLPFLHALPLNEHPIENELLCIVFTFIGGMDLALTVASLTRILDRMEAVEAQFNERMEAGVQTVQQGPAAVGSVAVRAAQSVGETATIAAMLAADSARERVADVAETAAIATMLAADSARERAGNVPGSATVAAAARVARERAADITESAAIATMLASESARDAAGNMADAARSRAELPGQEMAERVRLVMQSMGSRERYHIRSIRTFRPVRRKGQGEDSSERLRRLFRSVQDDAEERQIRRK